MNTPELNAIAKAMVAKGKGLLAADESAPTIAKRFKKFNIDNTPDTRRAWRELLLGTPGLSQYVSGAILYDETIRQTTSDGTPFAQFMQRQGMIPGIKVDTGAKELALHDNEKVTEGLDGLRERLKEYHELGARFCKWRAVITIGPGLPSSFCIDANAHALARYSALCQENGLVPIVEPEVLIEGDHSLERCYEVSVATLRALFRELAEHRVAFEGAILKASMAISGLAAPKRAGVDEVADTTVRCLLSTVPALLAGVVFLSGGQSPEEATAHLNAMNVRSPNLPWPLSFSYSRALQEPVLSTWLGKPGNVAAAQKELL
ncbi:MAG TPA: class I fructose-bisphosphate aldolase, partial [Burkholderiales bacterium]|nr:class I fructose-bisphosphate aldolase [Burkholderiales bacterium]